MTRVQLEKTLKGCPYCADKGNLGTTSKGWKQVSCRGCYSEGPPASTFTKAAENWNKRVPL